MKRLALSILVSLLLVSSANFLFAQGDKKSDVGKISLLVVVPQTADRLSRSQLSKLESKIHRIVTANGLSGSGYNSNFVIYPKIEIYDEKLVEGMQNITVVETEFNLFIKQVDNNTIFSTYSKSINGSGFSKEKAINDAIKKIPTKDKSVQEFIAGAKDKIVAYYNEKCDDLIKDAQSQSKMKSHRQALAMYMSIPSEAKCYDAAQANAITTYKAYQNQVCKKQIQQAEAAAANNNYSGALAWLGRIDPESGCSQQAKNLMNQMAKKVDADEKRDWDFMMKKYDDSVELEKYRIEAIRDILSAYFKSKPQTVNYTTILR